MNRTHLWSKSVFVAVMLLGGSLCAVAQDAKAEIKAIYQKIMVCMSRADCATVATMLHPEYRMIDGQGKVYTRQESVEMMNGMAGMAKNVKGKFIFDDIVVTDNEAMVWVTMSVSMDMKMGGKWQRSTHKMKYLETLRMTEKGWKFTETIELPN